MVDLFSTPAEGSICTSNALKRTQEQRFAKAHEAVIRTGVDEFRVLNSMASMNFPGRLGLDSIWGKQATIPIARHAADLTEGTMSLNAA
uniref:Uncharacterized protein n=1 Tax=Arundo donax TaxID=35708 RepID=A0A0A9EA62_ARUDO